MRKHITLLAAVAPMLAIAGLTGATMLAPVAPAHSQSLGNIIGSAQKVEGTASRDVGQIANSELGGLIQNVMCAQHSQAAETASDDYALNFMAPKGYDREACATAMYKLATMGGGGGIALLQTHPDPAKRAKRMRAKIC
jgi:predicted Zn-dependent protease